MSNTAIVWEVPEPLYNELLNAQRGKVSRILRWRSEWHLCAFSLTRL
jgi:hypothetical protein